MSPLFSRKVPEIYFGNYRPITLTSVVGKMLESIIRDKIVSYLDRHSLIRDSQYGFRHKRSCLSNLLTFYNDLFTVHDFIAKFADNTKIGNSVISDRDRQNLQEDLRKISAWSDRWEMPFNVNKCNILQVGTRKKKNMNTKWVK